jgi:hypothetical protein
VTVLIPCLRMKVQTKTHKPAYRTPGSTPLYASLIYCTVGLRSYCCSKLIRFVIV